MTATPDPADSPWKEALAGLFPEFLAFYFPLAHQGIDWRAGHEFLDQELAQVVQDAELGRRLVDKLVQIRPIAGGDAWVYVHVEIQGHSQAGFAERLFVYNYRLFDRYRKPVATLALLADDAPGWRPSRFGFELFGCRHELIFPAVKLLDYAPRLPALLEDPNPFALLRAREFLLWERPWPR